MPFGGTVTSDDWDTGTGGRGGRRTTTLVDFSLQDIDGTLAEAVETWQGKAEGKARIDYGLHVAITNLTEAAKAEIPSLPGLGVSTVKIFMAYKGTPLYTADEDLFEAMQIAREAGVLVLVHAENGDVIAKLQAQALERGDVEPRWHGLTRPERVEAEATNRAIRLAELADTPLLVVHVSCPPPWRCARARTRQHHLPETCPQLRLQYADLAPRTRAQVHVLAAARPLQPRGAAGRAAGGDLQIFGSDHCTFNSPAKEAQPRRLQLIQRPSGWRRPRRCGPKAAAGTSGSSSSPCSPPTRRASGSPSARGGSRRAPTPTSSCGTTHDAATQANRHNRLDYAPYEGKTLTAGRPRSTFEAPGLPRRRGRGGAGQRALPRAPSAARRPRPKPFTLGCNTAARRRR
jgi:hypothetical protein